ncbi:hypothetical protein JJL45_04445 [Tamlana sp. s12]|uniref:hypothetical protein n=1 Tax=Tamlana sp. s12 TaxID=1630406 RepID=UPI0008015A0E|nr:hypothetical protein [Tamlana sp. s12]OBQ55133.1 hypothetical protein VQ01_10435 [Tamlana sp. s12]QQY83245.1 hypothetical protein JJL45_04445 [Tamlana sp. s12]
MIRLITIVLALTTYALSFSQSANLDREYVHISYVKLPSKPIVDSTKRTYSTNTRGISLSGFSKVKTNGTLDVNFSFLGTKIGEVNINKIKHESKDKEGNVTSTSYTYKVQLPYTSSASITINNSENPENNYQRNYTESDNYTSSEFSSYKAAQDHYNNNRYTIRNDYTNKHKKAFINTLNSNLNSTYGYVIKSSENAQLWILGSKKHPEHVKHYEVYESMQTAFSKMKYNITVDELKAELQPSIDYFTSLIPKYTGDKKKARKIRYASYYNIAKMYYYLDMPEKTKEYGQKIIDNDYDKSDGKNFISMADDLLEKFEANKIKTRHFEVVTEDLSNEEEPEEESDALEIVKAYLVSKAGDTTLVDMETKDISKIAYQIRTIQYDDNNAFVGTKIKNAKKYNEVLFLDGTHYKNIPFKESSIKGESIDAGQMLLGGASEKLCKVIYESKKLNLYMFNNEETVILTPDSDKGKSTMSTGFVFGFKKKLMKIAEGCPEIVAKAENNEFKNTPEELVRFGKELNECSM